MEAVRRAIASGDIDAFVDAFRQAIDDHDRATVRAGMQTLRQLPRGVARPLVRRVRESWPRMLAAHHAAFVESPLADGELPPSGPLQALLRRAVDGDREGALADALRQGPGSPRLQGEPAQLRTLLTGVPGRASLPRPLVVDRGEDIVVSAPGARGTMFVFSGLADRVGLDLPVFDAYVAAAGFGAVYLRDRTRKAYANGIDVVAGGRAGFADWLRGQVAAATGEVVFVGSSAGGLGAVDWACELQVGCVICLATPSSTRRARLRAHGDQRVPLLIAFWEQAGVDVDLEERLTASAFRGRLRLLHGAAMPTDRAHAQSLAHLPGVVLEPVDGARHDVALALAMSGRLVEVLGSE